MQWFALPAAAVNSPFATSPEWWMCLCSTRCSAPVGFQLCDRRPESWFPPSACPADPVWQWIEEALQTKKKWYKKENKKKKTGQLCLREDFNETLIDMIAAWMRCAFTVHVSVGLTCPRNSIIGITRGISWQDVDRLMWYTIHKKPEKRPGASETCNREMVRRLNVTVMGGCFNKMENEHANVVKLNGCRFNHSVGVCCSFPASVCSS